MGPQSLPSNFGSIRRRFWEQMWFQDFIIIIIKFILKLLLILAIGPDITALDSTILSTQWTSFFFFFFLFFVFCFLSFVYLLSFVYFSHSFFFSK